MELYRQTLSFARSLLGMIAMVAPTGSALWVAALLLPDSSQKLHGLHVLRPNPEQLL
jgi:hypothetical protein